MPNPYATRSRNTKEHDNITRIPVVQEKAEDMPTVFRKKGDTIFKNDSMEQKSQYLTSQTRYSTLSNSQNYNFNATDFQKKEA